MKFHKHIKEPSIYNAILLRIIRHTHTLKYSCSSASLQQMPTVSNSMCPVFAKKKKKNYVSRKFYGIAYAEINSQQLIAAPCLDITPIYAVVQQIP